MPLMKNPKWVQAGIKAAKKRRWRKARDKAAAAERASKVALRKYCDAHGWHVAFFEGKTGAPRTGIIDAIVYRLGRQNPDKMDLRLVQLKGGGAGIKAEEIGRLKAAAEYLGVKYLVAEFDTKRNKLELLPDELEAD